MIDISIINRWDDDAFADWYRIFEAAWSADFGPYPAPPEAHMRGFARSRGETHEHRYWMLSGDDGPVGVAEDVRPITDNIAVVLGEIYVHPRHRRNGAATKLFQAIRNDARRSGRTRWIGVIRVLPGGGRGGAKLAESLGFTPALTEHIVRLVPPVARGGPWLEDMQQRSADYEIVTWTTEVPDHLIPGAIHLGHRMTVDAPMGSLGYEPEAYDTERIRSEERLATAMGMELWGAGAVTNGRLVALSKMAVDTVPGRPVYQWDTIVDSAHRGHRLGLAVKWANLDRLGRERTDVTAIYSENAAANAPMLAINRLLGFEVIGDSVECQLDW